MSHFTATSTAETAVYDVLAQLHADPQQMIHDPSQSRDHTLKQLMVAAVEADRRIRADTAERIATSVVYSNYGPEGDIDVFREAEALAAFATDTRDVDAKLLLAAALDTGHLDPDGILAMMREAAR